MTGHDRHAKDASGAYVEPSQVEAEDGLVSVDGPDGVAVTLTPDAALETSDRLLHAGIAAQGQRIMKPVRNRSRGGDGST